MLSYKSCLKFFRQLFLKDSTAVFVLSALKIVKLKDVQPHILFLLFSIAVGHLAF